MPKGLIIVESPTKARTIQKYVGREYEVEATVGHIVDLPKSTLGVDVENDFAPDYQLIRGKRKVVQQLRKVGREADIVYLAPDPDREGEAIAWHVAQQLEGASGAVRRVLFHEITKKAILEALAHPLELNAAKYESQQARRILDRLVGYEISPLLWEKVRRGLSAGRVQSVAVRLVVEREREVRAFVPEEYWVVQAELGAAEPPPFVARLNTVEGRKAKVGDGATAAELVAQIRAGRFVVREVKATERPRPAPAPFITSRLQQDAARQYRFPARRTMQIAQSLYEGVPLGKEGQVGLITYMRTDSTRLSDEAVQAARLYIRERYGENYLSRQPRTFPNQKRAQDAHEAIRPTSLAYPPDVVKPHLKPDQYRLYTLIWNRFIACQMAAAVYHQTVVDIDAAERFGFRAQGSVLVFPGYTLVYTEGREASAADERDRPLPPLKEGDVLELRNLTHEQQFTQPPPRYSEAMLLRELEEQGIGRPSTYAQILSTILDKGYVVRQEGRFAPTELGTIVTDLLVESFPDILNVKFTAQLEDELDRVEEGSLAWLDVLRRFYGPFRETLQSAREHMRDVKRQEIPTNVPCERCGRLMVIRFGKSGSFLGCPGYPECRTTRDYDQGPNGEIIPRQLPTSSEPCPVCGGAMQIRNGRFGRFLACARYPECSGTRPYSTGVTCPEPQCSGKLVEKKSKKGKTFWSCSRYPECKFATWDRPIDRACPTCGAPRLFERTRRRRTEVHCPVCQHTEAAG